MRLELRNDIDELMERTIRFSTSGKTGDALVLIRLKEEGYTIKPLNQWNFPQDMEAFLDENIKALEVAWKQRQGIKDDFIPCLYPRYGIAEHTAFVAGDVTFGEDTSYPHPVIQDYEDVKKLELREDNVWLHLVVDGLAYLREKGAGKFAVMQRGAMSPLDLANALRGNDLFMDFYDHPEELHRFLEFCTEACEWYISRQKKVIGDFYGGTISGCHLWLPGNSIGHLSEDASVMCSPKIYKKFGHPYTEKLVQKYDVAFMHLHTAGVAAFKEIVKIDKLGFFELAPDPNQPRGIEVYKNHRELFGNKVMRLFITFDEIKEHLEFLKQAKTVLFCDVESVEEAKQITEFVRQELPVL